MLYYGIFSKDSPYVILVSFDGFRWDYSERGLTPNLDKMKNDGVHALSLQPCFPTKTFPNHYSLITGLYPENHGIIFNTFTNPFTKERYSLKNRKAVREGKWYIGESFWETAERNGIITGSYFWPGSELNDESRRPTYFKHYNHNQPYLSRVDSIINWLSLPAIERPRFISIYFHDTDSYGHDYGPNSEQLNKSISRLDSIMGYLHESLERINLIDSTNIILVSDHGMTEISVDKTINIEKMLDGYEVDYGGTKTLMMIDAQKKDEEEIYKLLKENENHYKVYMREDFPEYLHFSRHPFIYPILVMADLNWSLVTNRWLGSMSKYSSRGNHGYDNTQIDMHGVFIASGPSLKENFKCGSLMNIDVYPLLCELFGISQKTQIDGKLNRIVHVLN